MKNLFKYPLNFEFKLMGASNNFRVIDASAETVFYIREKFFKLKDHIEVYRNESDKEVLYEFSADKILDLQQNFSIQNADKEVLGKMNKKITTSVTKTTYQIQDKEGKHVYVIKGNKTSFGVLDYVFDEIIPFAGELLSSFLHPKFILTDVNGYALMEMKKKTGFWNSNYQVRKLSSKAFDEQLAVLSLILLLVQEKYKYVE